MRWLLFFVFKQKAAYERRISDWSSDVCSSDLSYTFAVDYRITPDVMVYGTTRRGVKQGGINIQSVVPASNGIVSAQPTFAPEKVTDYEIGIKADYHLGSVDSRTNIALFTADFSGLHRATSF